MSRPRKQRQNSQRKSQNNYSSSKDKSTETSSKQEEGNSNATTEKTEEPSGSKRNDPEWYGRVQALLEGAANYAFGYAYGVKYDLPLSTKWGLTPSDYTIGDVKPYGVCALHMKPAFGFSDGSTSPLNVAAASLYAYVRHLNSGRKNYDQADLLQYLVAIANLMSFVIWQERMYSFAMTWSDQNRYIPKDLLRINGIDPDNFIKNLANFRLWLNSFINKISVFAVPADITYFNKMTFMFRNVYLENGEGNIKDQMYLYVPDGFYQYALDNDGIGMLNYIPWTNTNATVDDIINFGENLFSGMFNNEDASLMSGDIFKVYGDNIIRLPSMDEFLELPLVYDPMILWQMKNTTVTPVMRFDLHGEISDAVADSRKNFNQSLYSLGQGRTQAGYPGHVYQDNQGNLMSVERLVNHTTTIYSVSLQSAQYVMSSKLLTSDIAHPDPGVVMESSRNLIGCKTKGKLIPDNNGTLSNVGWIECGSFICMKMDAIDTSHSVVNSGALLWETTTSFDGKYFSRKDFKYAPLMYTYRLNSGNNGIVGFNVVDDVNNYVILSDENITKLHETALLNLFFVPGVAKIS